VATNYKRLKTLRAIGSFWGDRMKKAIKVRRYLIFPHARKDIAAPPIKVMTAMQALYRDD
jgi:hypothetical protein